MLLEGLTMVVALYCAEHNVENCPTVHQQDISHLQTSALVKLKGCYGTLPSGKKVIIIDDDEGKGDRWDTFYHEFGHFIEEIQGDDASLHGIGHKQSTKAAKWFTRKHTGGWK